MASQARSKPKKSLTSQSEQNPSMATAPILSESHQEPSGPISEQNPPLAPETAASESLHMPSGLGVNRAWRQALRDRIKRAMEGPRTIVIEALHTVPELITEMQDKDAEKRSRSVKGLRRHSIDLASEAVPALMEALGDPVKSVRRETLATVAWLEEEAKAAIPALIDMMLKDPDESLREEAGRVLLKIDPQHQAIASVMKVIRNNPWRVAITHLLAKIGPDARLLRRQLQEMWSGHAESPSTDLQGPQPHSSEPKGPHEDGPEKPNSFWWNNECHSLPPIAHRLLTALWGKEKVAIEDVTEEVWGTDYATESSIKSTLCTLGKRLKKIGTPFTYRQKNGFFIRAVWPSRRKKGADCPKIAEAAPGPEPAADRAGRRRLAGFARVWR